MITTTVSYVDDVRFYYHELVPPYEMRHGVRVECITSRLLNIPGAQIIPRQLRLRYVGFDYSLDANVYVLTKMAYIQYRCVQKFIKAYWHLVKFLYDNARMFKQIPLGECFSWRYFTPYMWVKAIKGKL